MISVSELNEQTKGIALLSVVSDIKPCTTAHLLDIPLVGLGYIAVS